ncbi:MAG: diphosphomevalonate decarboxylase [Terrimesophilobacter sp.]
MTDTNGGVRTASARAHSNIALAKYWGKRDTPLNIPAVGSISITLDALHTDTTVTFDPALPHDQLVLDDREQPAARITPVLDLVRELGGFTVPAQVHSRNNFPTGAGLASSASGFAALVVAACRAAGVDATTRELSILARRGSASAARSLFGGYVELHTDLDSDGAYAEQLRDETEWPLSVVVAITDRGAKPVPSTAGMQATSATSPFYSAWVDNAESELALVRSAIAQRDFTALGERTEHSCLALHSLMFTTQPPLIYWNAATVALIHTVRELRASGTATYFTIDAGPQVKVLCQPQDADAIAAALASVTGVVETRISGLGAGAHTMPNHATGSH